MMIPCVIAALVSSYGLAADQPLSPSLEADAEYLLTTADLMSAHLDMRVTGTEVAGGRTVVRTTGAELVFSPAEGRLVISQLLGRKREVVRVDFPPHVLAGLRVERSGPGAVLLRNAAGSLELRVNGDSLLMLRSQTPLPLRCTIAFEPASVRAFQGDRLLLDEWGCVGVYYATGHGKTVDRLIDHALDCSVAAGQFWWLAVGPPRPYPWEDSLKERVAWHWSMQTGYPPDADIERWSRYANILLQQSEVMLWQDWSLRFVPRKGLAEFQRVNRTCERLGMRNIVYTSPFYFLTGTGLEPKAMNSFDNFAVTGFSPGDGRGLNWPIFVAEITKVMAQYQPDGLYFDGIYDNIVRTYLLSRKAREIVGDRGILEFHATGSPPGGGVYLPQIDACFTFVLRGEGCQAAYADPDYLRYFVSTYNISNSIGVLCNNNNYPLDEKFVTTLLDNNIRLHYLLGGPEDPRTQGMEKYYWPALTPGLEARVEARQADRQQAFVRARQDYERAASSRMPSLPVAWQEDFRDPALTMKLPAPAPSQGLETALPASWRGYLSPRSAGSLAAADGQLRIEAHTNTVAFLERDLPPDTVAVECRLRGRGEAGMSWGPGLVLRIGDTYGRIGLRTDDRAQTDRAGEQRLHEGYPAGEWYYLRLRLHEQYLVSELSRDGVEWQALRVERVPNPGGPKHLIVGKVPYDGGRTEFTDPGGRGGCDVTGVKLYCSAAGRP